MNEFQFGRPIKICGKVYYLTSNMKMLSAQMLNTAALMKQVSALEIGDAEKMEQATKLCRACIDKVLGQGSFDEIFAIEEPSTLNLAALMQFIASEISAWKQEVDKGTKWQMNQSSGAPRSVHSQKKAKNGGKRK